MRTISVTSDIDAPRQAVWDVLADFPNIAKWNGGVKKSYSTSDAPNGVGATRHCDLAPAGELEETIHEWVPNDRLVVSIDSSKRSPLKNGKGTFVLTGDDAGPVHVDVQVEYTPKGGSIGALFGKSLDKQFMKAFGGLMDDLAKAAAERSTT